MKNFSTELVFAIYTLSGSVSLMLACFGIADVIRAVGYYKFYTEDDSDVEAPSP